MPFEPEDWSWIKERVADALELPSAERDEYLAGLEREDPRRAGEVRSLVEAAAEDDDDLLHTTGGVLALRAPLRDWAGERIGGYVIQRFLASGGMGEVYEALQEGTGRRVALKFLSRDTPRDRGRFQLEARLLGRLEHEGIAQVLDADVHRAADGSRWPYLALEFVDGEPLTAFVQRARLERAEVLELFVQICRALEHAHKKGIVHRDLKPDNILVAAPAEADGAPRPKVLDFGIAALLDPGDGDTTTRLTRHGDLIGTLAYMAPEQVAGDPDAVDARTDIHALGVLLFELLTGRLPFELAGRSLAESMELLRRALPPSLSQLDRSLRGDLDTIVATALAKEPERRYASAAALADDVERHLNHEPIAARPASRLYRAAKFTRRHRALVGFTSLSMVLLLGGIVGTSVGLLRASRAQADAEQQAQLAQERKEQAEDERAKALAAQLEAEQRTAHTREVNRFFGDLLNAPTAWELGSDVRFKKVLDAHAPQIEARFAAQPESRAQLHVSIGWAYFHMFEVEPALHHLELGRDACIEAFGPEDPNTLRAERELLHARLIMDPAWNDAIEASDALIERLARRAAEHSGVQVDYLLARSDRATALERTGRMEEALDELLDVVREARALGPDFDADSFDNLLNSLGNAHNTLANFEEGLAAFEELERRYAERLPDAHPDAINNRLNIASTLNELGRLDSAAEVYAELDAVVEATFEPDHPTVNVYRRSSAVNLLNQGRHASAAELLEVALASSERVQGELHIDTLYSLNTLIVARMHLGEWERAEALTTDMLERIERNPGSEALGLTARGHLANILSAQGRYEESRDVIVETHAAMADMLGRDHPTTLIQLNNLGSLVHKHLGDAEAAIPMLREARDAWPAALPDEVTNYRLILWNLGRAEAEAGELDAAVATLVEVGNLAASDPYDRVDPGAWRRVMHDVLVALGRPADAEAFAD